MCSLISWVNRKRERGTRRVRVPPTFAYLIVNRQEGKKPEDDSENGLF